MGLHGVLWLLLWGGWLVCFVLDCAGRLLLLRGCLLCVLVAMRLGGGCVVVVLGSRLLVGWWNCDLLIDVSVYC